MRRSPDPAGATPFFPVALAFGQPLRPTTHRACFLQAWMEEKPLLFIYSGETLREIYPHVSN